MAAANPAEPPPTIRKIELAAGLSDLSRNVDQFSRLSHCLPPGAFVVSVRIVAPKARELCQVRGDLRGN